MLLRAATVSPGAYVTANTRITACRKLSPASETLALLVGAVLGHYASGSSHLAAHMFSRLDHFLVMTHDVDGTRDFYRDVLGFGEGLRPELGFRGHWLYLGEVAVIHIAEWSSYTAHSQRLGIPVTVPAPGTGVLDHVAFNAPAAQHAVLMQRLRARALPHHPHDSPDIGLRQIFLEDPNGLKLELNFWER